ncbi:major facilitator superfamily domain-containing protein [Flagelloscypha sp. PMI_526]|nr:major facilitator superfamily domain-containing protein [Flagelloscypha sp. PMI_526]
MLLGLALFGTGTIYCGMAQSMETLIVARAVAGMGGGGVMTVSSVTVTDLIPLKQRGLYQGMANILFGLGAGIGGPLGGWINDTLGWRYAFLLQLPVLAFSVILVIWKVNIKLPGEIENQKLSLKLKKIDFLGSFTLVGTVGSLLLAISLKSSEELPWSHPVVYGLLITSAVSGVLFFLSEKYWAPFPVMPLRLMTKRTPLAVSLNNLVTSMAAFSMLYNIPLYFEAVRLSSAANAGLHLLPHSIAISSGSVFAGWMMRRTGKLYNLSLTSAALTVLASALVFFWNEGTTTLHLWLDIVPQGFGMSSLITTTLIAMIAGVRKEDMAVATGITYLFRTTGQVLGVSLSGALLQSILLQKLRSRFSDPNLISQIRHSADFVKELNPHDRQLAVDSYADALRVIFICQMALNFLGFLTCLPIQENDLPGTKQEEQAHYDRAERRQTNQVSNEGLNA